MKTDERERIPVEGRFGVMKRKYGLDCTMTKLEKTQRTSIGINSACAQSRQDAVSCTSCTPYIFLFCSFHGTQAD